MDLPSFDTARDRNVLRRGHFVAGAVVLLLTWAPSVDRAFAQLTGNDLRKLDQYEAAAGSREQAALAERARAEFAGRGVDIATYFLIHTDPRPRNGAYFFAFGAVGDVETALVLVRAFVSPPQHETGMLDRHFGEIAVAIEAVLGNNAVRGDPRVVGAIERAALTAQRKPSSAGLPEALEAIRLIGKCTSAEAGQVLGRLANDKNPAIRTAAVQALGELKIPAAAASPVPGGVPATEGSPVDQLLRTLTTDGNPTTRAQAATSLGGVEPVDVVVSGLTSAIDAENDPRVLDAIVLSLRRLGRPIEDPTRCQNLMGRAWDATIAEQMVACWYRGGRTRADLIQAAASGEAVQRAAALGLLTGRQSTPARTIGSSRISDAAAFDSATRDRLLESDVWLLSQGSLSETTIDRGHEALWILSRMDMSRALRAADRIGPIEGRYRASAALAGSAGDAYDAERRAQQFTLPLIVAGIAGLAGALIVPFRRALFLLCGSAAIWALSTLQSSGVRDLPPSPLQLLTVRAIAFLAAGTVTAVMALAWRRQPTGWSAAAARVVTTAIGAGVLAALICATTRNARLFPIGSGGWELIFDPLAAAILATAAATGLSVVDTAVARR